MTDYALVNVGGSCVRVPLPDTSPPKPPMTLEQIEARLAVIYRDSTAQDEAETSPAGEE